MSKPVDRQDLLEICRCVLADADIFTELCEIMDIKDEEMLSIYERVILETEGEPLDWDECQATADDILNRLRTFGRWLEEDER